MKKDWCILMLQPNDLTLEDVFIKIVAGDATYLPDGVQETESTDDSVNEEKKKEKKKKEKDKENEDEKGEEK